MRLTIGIFVLVAALGAIAMWMYETFGSVFTGVLLSGGFGIVVSLWVTRSWLRNRRRRRLMDMQDSALW